MDSERPDEIILSPGKPTRPRRGFFRWLLSAFGMSKREPWSLIVGPYQVGIIIWDGAVLDIFTEGTQTLPEGDVQTYILTTAPVKFTYMIKGRGKSSNQNDIVLDPPPLTSDGQHATGRIDLTVSVMAQGSRFASVIPEKADRLLQLLGLSGDVVKESDIARMIKSELSPKLLALDLRGYSADELRNNQGPLLDFSNSLRTELASSIDRFGLQLDDFYINWAPQPQKATSPNQPEPAGRIQKSKSTSARQSPTPATRPPKQMPTQDAKVRKRSRTSQIRRQSASNRTSNESTLDSPVKKQLRDSNLFMEGKPQTSTGTVRFQVTEWNGATIYVPRDEQYVAIFDRAFRNDNFPNNSKLYDFVRSQKRDTTRSGDNLTYRLHKEHVGRIIELIRSGLPNAPKARQGSLPSQTRSKRSVNMSTTNMTVLDKFKEAFSGQHKETKSNDTITLGRGATVYFRKTRAGPNEARIHSKWVKNFPNGRNLQSYLERNKVPLDARPDYKIGQDHVDQVIAILKEAG